MIQIVGVLNAHLNSLQWMDAQAVQLTQKINDIQDFFRPQQHDSGRYNY